MLCSVEYKTACRLSQKEVSLTSFPSPWQLSNVLAEGRQTHNSLPMCSSGHSWLLVNELHVSEQCAKQGLYWARASYSEFCQKLYLELEKPSR